MKTYRTIIRASTASMIEVFAVEQARDIFGFNYRYRVVPDYQVGIYGYGDNESPGADITVEVEHKDKADETFKLYWDTDDSAVGYSQR